MSPRQEDNGSVSNPLQENGTSDSLSLITSERALQEVIQQPHLVEFSEAMTTVARALSRAAEGKASAEAEAAEWKRKFELEKLRNLERAVQEFIQQPHLVEFSEAMTTVARALSRAAEGKASAEAEAVEWKRKFELEKLRNLEVERKAFPPRSHDCFHLADEPKACLPANGKNGHCCGANGICNHEVLRDGASTSDSESVNKKILKKTSFKLSWNSEGANGNQYKHDVVSFDRGNITTTERSSKQIFLKWDSKPQTVLVLTKPNSTDVQLLCCELVRWLREQKLKIYVEPRVRSELLHESPSFDFVQTWKDDKEVFLLHTKIDLVVTLGGDGTVLWAASLFKGPVPPVVPLAMGSLGFMTPFSCEQYRESLESVLHGPISITLRHRLQCNVIRGKGKHEFDTEEPILVLNEVTIDRGISSYLTNLECYLDNTFVTRVQGDGLILSTTSGSTAYSLAAGGSMVHPQVPGILFTPICPHSLSFRPLILPDHVTLRVEVPLNSRSPAWASFDGKGRKELGPGDALICSMAPWPVPTACQGDSTSDFMRSIHEGLHWNLRQTQGADGRPV